MNGQTRAAALVAAIVLAGSLAMVVNLAVMSNGDSRIGQISSTNPFLPAVPATTAIVIGAPTTSSSVPTVGAGATSTAVTSRPGAFGGVGPSTTSSRPATTKPATAPASRVSGQTSSTVTTTEAPATTPSTIPLPSSTPPGGPPGTLSPGNGGKGGGNNSGKGGGGGNSGPGGGKGGGPGPPSTTTPSSDD